MYMGASTNYLPCDGCGLPASPDHIAERLQRLEHSTRFRPIHIGVLFIALMPPIRLQDDFYAADEKNEYFDPFLTALEIPPAAASVRLLEFQQRGYFQAFLSECPSPQDLEPAAATIARLSPTLIRRIRFNYKPKLIAPIGQELAPLVDVLRGAGIGPIVALAQGAVLPIPRTGDREWHELFRGAVATVAPREYPSSEYDRIQVTQTERKLGAGGNS